MRSTTDVELGYLFSAATQGVLPFRKLCRNFLETFVGGCTGDKGRDKDIDKDRGR